MLAHIVDEQLCGEVHLGVNGRPVPEGDIRFCTINAYTGNQLPNKSSLINRSVTIKLFLSFGDAKGVHTAEIPNQSGKFMQEIRWSIGMERLKRQDP